MSRDIKSLSRALYAIVILFYGISTQGCRASRQASVSEQPAKSTSDREFRVVDKTYTAPQGVPIWKAQLNTIQKNERIRGRGFELVNYTYLYDIDTESELEDVKQRYLDESAKNSDQIMIHQVKSSKEDYRQFLDRVMPTTKKAKALVPVSGDNSPKSEAVYFFKRDDAGLVKLEWNYRDEKRTSFCVVSVKDGIVYDDFMYFKHFVTAKAKNVTGESDNRFSVSRSSNNPLPNGTSISYEFYKSQSGFNFYGVKVFEFEIDISVSGTVANNEKTIEDKSILASSYHIMGYECKANVQQTSFETGKNGHLGFEFDYGHGSGVSVSTNQNGNGVTISGGKGGGGTGIEYVSPRELE